MNYLKNTLEFALGLKRPHHGKSVQALISHLIATLPDAYVDKHGNVHCTVGESRTLFSSHTDTVHRKDGVNAYLISQEQVVFGGKYNEPRTIYRGYDQPLGADCGAGVALMVHMIMNAVPGHYVFHAAEEVGGLGSTALAKTGAFVGLFDRAIAFDRKATHSVITYQRGGQCCSTQFAEALSAQLNAADESFMYAPDDTGVYTDTAEYVDQIPECTNLSVGYYHEHSADERLDFTFLAQLADALVKVQWETLPIGVKDEKVDVDLFGSDYDFSLDTLYETLDSYPNVHDQLTDLEFNDAAAKLGSEGIWALVDAVESGFFDERKFLDALMNPTGFLEKMKIETDELETV